MFLLIFILGCGFYFLLAFIVAINPQQVNVKANKWLAFFLFSLACSVLDTPFTELKLYERFPHLIEFANVFILLVAPTLYLSISYFVNPMRVFIKKDYLHFAPSVVLLLLNITSEYPQNKGEEVKAELNTNLDFYDMLAGLLLLIIPMCIYWVLAYRKLSNHQRNIQLFSSSIETIDLSWLRNTLFGLAALIVLFLIEILNFFPAITPINTLFFASSALFLTYFIVKQQEIFPKKTQEFLEIQTLIAETEATTERRQLLTEAEIATLKPKIIALMETEKPYLDSELNLSKLAKMMGLSAHELSYLINVGFDDNFFVFVSKYRVEESKRLLSSDEYSHLSVLGIAFEAGFSSKTAFNTAFKKIVGLSPTEFQKQKMP